MIVYRKNETTGWRTLEVSNCTNQEIIDEVSIAANTVLLSKKQWWESQIHFLKRANKMFSQFADITITLNGKSL